MYLINQTIVAIALTIIAGCGLFIALEILEIRKLSMSIRGTLSLWPKGHLAVPWDRPISTMELGLMAYSVHSSLQKHGLVDAHWEPTPDNIEEELVGALNTLIELDPTISKLTRG